MAKLSASAFTRLQPVLVAGPATTQNSPFLPQRWPNQSPVLIAPRHRGMARLSGLDNTGKVHPPKVVTNRSINRARRRSFNVVNVTDELRQISHRWIVYLAFFVNIIRTLQNQPPATITYTLCQVAFNVYIRPCFILVS